MAHTHTYLHRHCFAVMKFFTFSNGRESVTKAISMRRPNREEKLKMVYCCFKHYRKNFSIKNWWCLTSELSILSMGHCSIADSRFKTINTVHIDRVFIDNAWADAFSCNGNLQEMYHSRQNYLRTQYSFSSNKKYPHFLFTIHKGHSVDYGHLFWKIQFIVSFLQFFSFLLK